MELLRTIKLKLNVDPKEFLPTIQAYTAAFNYICKIGFDKKCINGVTLHHLTYKYCRKEFKLKAELTTSARMKATEAIKSSLKLKGSCPKSKLCSIRLTNKHSYSLSLEKKIISILTLDGRKKIPFSISEYHKEYFNSWKYTIADLCIKKNKVYLHIVFQKNIEDIRQNNQLIGIDRGINKLAVTSTNHFYGGGKVKQISKKYQKLRSNLQKANTKSAKRHLKRLSGKEKRFQADINHQISKKIINSLNPGDTIILENLTGIRNKRLRKPQRTLINNWSFYQLEQFLIYKGAAKNIEVVHIDPRYTSQRCSKCGTIDKKNRKTQSNFCCIKCNFKLNADLNAARNICLKHLDATSYPDRATINKPNVSDQK